jgi:hypothetical protein
MTTTVTDTEVIDTMTHFQMDYGYACRLDGSRLTVDVGDLDEGKEFARHLGIDDQPMTTEPYGDMLRCSWETVQVLD